MRPADVTISKGHAAPLKIYAPGAVRYVWTVNGQTLDEFSGEISVPWMPDRPSSSVMVTPVYRMSGAETLGAPISVTITNRPESFSVFVR